MYRALNQNHNPNYGRPVLCSTFVAQISRKTKDSNNELEA